MIAYTGTETRCEWPEEEEEADKEEGEEEE